MPVTSPTSVCWGGPGYSTLYVTSSQAGLSQQQLETKQRAGSTYAITGLGTKGFPPKEFECNLNSLHKYI